MGAYVVSILTLFPAMKLPSHVSHFELTVTAPSGRTITAAAYSPTQADTLRRHYLGSGAAAVTVSPVGREYGYPG